MSHRIGSTAAPAAARTGIALLVMAMSALIAPGLLAQSALGTPFIGNNNLSFYAAELTRSGGPETTTLLGVVYGHRFGDSARATRLAMVLRASARPVDDAQAAVMDASAQAGVAHKIAAVPGLSVAASAGVEMMGWGDDAARTGRLQVTIPATAGASYDFKVKRATLSPFAMASVARYDLRTSRNDVRQSIDQGWDARYTTGLAVRLNEVVISTSRIRGEYGMPSSSRWAFSAGISY